MRPQRQRYSKCYSSGMDWDVYQTDEASAWIDELRRSDPDCRHPHQIEACQPQELRPRQTMIRILFVFDPRGTFIVGFERTSAHRALRVGSVEFG